MSRVRLFIVAALAAIAVSAVGASTSSAVFTLTENKCKEGKPAFCWDSTEKGINLRELTGEEEFTVTLETAAESGFEALLEAKFGAEVVHIECPEATGSGTVKQPTPLTVGVTGEGKITFKGPCVLLEPLAAKCTIEKEIPTNVLTATVLNTKELEFKPKVGTIFTEIKFAGEKCPATIKGSQPVTGTIICEWLEAEVDLKGHLLECNEDPTKDKLKLGGNAATLLGEFEWTFPTLEGTDFWDIALA